MSARQRLENLPPAVGQGDRPYLWPIDIAPRHAGAGQALAGGALAFRNCALVVRSDSATVQIVAPLQDILAWADTRGGEVSARIAKLAGHLTATRRSPLGGAFERPLLMGIVNATPDSFSDAGRHADPAAAVSQALRLRDEGADILDVGGESVRPGASPVSAEAECRRVLPVIEALAAQGAAMVSIDSRKAAVQRAALAKGAGMINDVSALTYDRESLAVAQASDVPVALMHMPGATAALDADTHYADVALDVFDYLEARIEACTAAGIPRARLIVDPGIGFGKHGADNLAILRQIALFHGLGCPLLLGISRKGLTGALDRRHATGERLPGTLAATLAAAGQGVQIFRVHDVAATRQALSIWQAIVDRDA